LKLDNTYLIIGVCGCMSQQVSVVNRILQKHQQVDLIFGTHNIHRLPNLVQEAMFSKAQVVEVWSKEGDIIENLPKVRHGKIKAWENIMYGCDKFCTYCIGDLMNDMHKIDIPRVRFTTSHPRDFDDHLVEVLAKGGNLLDHIHLPVQSGSSEILRKMNRKYTRESYLELVRKIKAAIP